MIHFQLRKGDKSEMLEIILYLGLLYIAYDLIIAHGILVSLHETIQNIK